MPAYDAEIAKLMDVVGKLERQRADLQQHRHNLTSSTAPIRRLPNELLVEIFYRCISGSWERDKESVGMAAWDLGQVSSHWRRVALASKKLWSFIDVNLNEIPGACATATGGQRLSFGQEVVRTYLERSDPVPLTISIWSLETDRFVCTHPILAALTSQSFRWRDATIILGAAYFGAGETLSTIEGSLPLLERLVLEIEDGYGNMPETQIGYLGTCPKLREATITWLDPMITLPLKQLTTLQIWGCDQTVVINVLLSCSSLERLVIENFGYSKHDLRTSVSVSSNIRDMSLAFTSWSTPCEYWAAPLFDALTLPRLQKISLTCVPKQYGEITWPQRNFIPFLQRSSCPLETLTLDRITISDTDLVGILPFLPSLTTLHIVELPARPIVTDHVLKYLEYSAFTTEHDVEAIIPRLTHLKLVVAPSFLESNLLNMVESRLFAASLRSGGSGGVGYLKSLSLTFMKRSTREDQLSKRLQGLWSHGLRFVLAFEEA